MARDLIQESVTQYNGKIRKLRRLAKCRHAAAFAVDVAVNSNEDRGYSNDELQTRCAGGESVLA
ncbi:hypothetical protein PG995_013271 [Apiospora arundinis]